MNRLHRWLVKNGLMLPPLTDEEKCGLAADRLQEAFHRVALKTCDGSYTCPAEIHIHGCYQDKGVCDDIMDHERYQ